MQNVIEEQLKEIEEKENVKIIYCVESGSRAWGFASPDSDYDVRFIYVRNKEYYLKLNKNRDVIEWRLDDVLDINGWDIQKALRLLYKSNPTLFEWSMSPMVYKTTPQWEKISGIISQYFLEKTGVYHYLSMAKGNYREYLKTDEVKLKKYFYVIRPILACKWILNKKTAPPMLFSELMNECLDDELKPEINRLLEIKKQTSELGKGKRIDVINDYIEKELAEIEKKADMIENKYNDWEILNKIFLEILEQYGGNMAYSELIKNFENIRDYISQFYVYGFKRRKDYDKKSSRSYDNERRRIESWLGEYMCFTNESDGKSAFLSLDSRTVLHNPLYKAFKAKSFTDKDIMLHFYILDILKNKSLSSSEIADEITNEYFSMFESVKECDESTIRKKLNEYEKLGLIKSEKQGRKRIYSLNECDVDLDKWRDALSFFTEVNPIGVIGSYLLDKFDNEENPFRFKHHYIFNALESEVLYDLLDIMNGNCNAEIKLFSNNMQKIKTYKVLPLKIYVSTYYGRRYVLVWNYIFKRFAFYRLDRIKEACKSNECTNKNEMMTRADTAVQKLWGVSFGKENYIEKLEMTVRIAKGEEYILKRLEREKRNGTIQKLANGDYKFTAEVYDASEMIPWIKTFTGRIVEIKCSNERVEKQIKEDFEMMKRIYEVR